VQEFYFPKVDNFKFSFRNLFIFIAKLTGAVSFSAAVLWSTLFIISRFASAISIKSAAGIITFGILTVLSAYPAMVAYMTFTLLFLDTFAPDTRMQVSALTALEWLHSTMVKLTGVDRDDTEGRELVSVNAEEKRHEQVMSRLDALERTLEDSMLWGNQRCGESDDDGNDVAEDVTGSFIG
jgi:ABC-type multidrug transport system fused ATPase/permease subunit